jgi:hypothetical protein
LWHLDVRWKELYGVCDAFMPCFGAVEFVAPVVLWCWSDVPAINTMWCPGLAHTGLLMDDDSCSRGRKWCFVEIKSTIELRVCRELGYAESWWLICEWHSRLRVAVHCGRNLHQRCMGQFLSVLLRPTMKWSLKHLMARSAAFCPWRYGAQVDNELHFDKTVQLSTLHRSVQEY